MPVETLTYTYTSHAEMARLFTAEAIDLRLNDLLSDNQILLELIEEATDFANQYCAQLYEEADLATSRWVRSRCTWYACHLLSQRSGNPALFTERLAQITEEFEKVFKQQLVIPRLPTRANFAPAMSNLVVDDRYRIHKLRVQQQISAGGAGSRQEPAYIPFTDLP